MPRSFPRRSSTVERLEPRAYLTAYTEFTGNAYSKPVTLPSGFSFQGYADDRRIARVGDQLFISAARAGKGELWVANVATWEAHQIAYTPAGGGAAEITPFRNGVLFAGFSPKDSNQVFFTDGTAEGTKQLTRTSGGNLAGNASHITAIGDLAYFMASDNQTYPSTGMEPYVTDGTPEGTRLIVDAMPLGTTTESIEFVGLVGFTYFVTSSYSESELWRFDPVTRECIKLNAPIPARKLANGVQLTVLNGKLIWQAVTGSQSSLLAYNPETGTTVPLARLPAVPIRTTGFKRDFTVIGNQLYFLGYQPETGRELWATDGTPAGTRLVLDTNPGPSDGAMYLPGPGYTGTRLYFTADTPGVGRELWTSDGTSDGTRLVRDLYPGATSMQPSLFVAAGEQVFFGTQDHGIGRTDGTFEGTGMLTAQDRPFGSTIKFSRQMIADDDAVYFFSGDSGPELWRLDAHDNTAPKLLVAQPNTSSTGIDFVYSEQVSLAALAADFRFENLTLGRPLSPGEYSIAYSEGFGTSRITVALPSLNAVDIDDANYRVTVPAAAARDLAGNMSEQGSVNDFYFLAGDLARDRQVNSADFSLLKLNFGRRVSPGVFSAGNLDGDNDVDLDDFTIFGQHYGKVLPAPSAPRVPLAPLPAVASSFDWKPVADPSTNAASLLA